MGQSPSGDGEGLVSRDRFAEDGDGALDRVEQPGDGQQGRRLAGPVRSEQGDHFPGVDVEAEIAHHRDAVVAGMEAVDLDQLLAHWCTIQS